MCRRRAGAQGSHSAAPRPTPSPPPQRALHRSWWAETAPLAPYENRLHHLHFWNSVNSLPTFCGPPAHPLPTFAPLPLLLGFPPGEGLSSWLRPLRGGNHITAVTLCAECWAACLSPNCPLCYQAWFMPDIYKVSGFVHLWDFNGASPWHQAWTKTSRVTETFVGAPREPGHRALGPRSVCPIG